jgi:hypothetical protein
MYFNTVMLESSWRGVKISSLQLGGVENVYCPYVPFSDLSALLLYTCFSYRQLRYTRMLV